MRAMLSFCFAILTLCACATPKSPPHGQVATREGLVEGTVQEGIRAWRGIEYARAERWKLPESVGPWQGIKKADAFGPSCPQANQATLIEDCLFLNVFADETASAGSNLPVIVWFHGGGLRAGSGGNGPRLWTRDGVVVVTFNYRLGALGFHDWLGWNESDPRNFGQADMVAALKWIKANISGFGGNPSQITIYGHSAGGMGVQLMMVDPRARGLYARAISDAGYGAWPFPTAANPDANTRMRIRYGPLETSASLETLVARTPNFHLPFVGGSDLADQPANLFTDGKQARVPFVAGFNSYDGGGTLAGAGFTPETFMARFADEPSIRAAYRDDFASSTLQGAQRVFGDLRYGVSTRQVGLGASANGSNTWLFYYDSHNPSQPGAGHGAHYQGEQGIFSGLNSPLKSYLLNFVKTGTPTASGTPLWERFSAANNKWMSFTQLPLLQSGRLDAKLDLLEKAALTSEMEKP